MADDLIPPPSPAGRAREGRPAELTGGDAPKLLEPPAGATAPEAPAAPSDQPPPAAPSRYRSRFGVIVGALIGVLLAAGGITAALILTQASEDRDAARWSSWRPKADDGLAAARQIAEHVQGKYRLANGNQLALVSPSPLQVSNIPLDVALRTAPQGGNIKTIDGDHAVMYTLNGLGPRGSIRSGKASTDRLLLLRREGVELALYTFRYIDDVDVVVALLPPKAPDKKQGSEAAAAEPLAPVPALFFRPGDLKRQLDSPLTTTIPPATPRPETIPRLEKRRIQGLTGHNLFTASFMQGQDTKAFLVLDRPSR